MRAVSVSSSHLYAVARQSFPVRVTVSSIRPHAKVKLLYKRARLPQSVGVHMGTDTPTYAVEWSYRTNKGRKAERLGPYMLQAALIERYECPEGQKRERRTQLGVISVEAISEVAQRHVFWVITEAALLPLDLDAETMERISAELSRVVPLPSEGEVTDFRNALEALRSAMRRAQK